MERDHLSARAVDLCIVNVIVESQCRSCFDACLSHARALYYKVAVHYAGLISKSLSEYRLNLERRLRYKHRRDKHVSQAKICRERIVASDMRPYTTTRSIVLQMMNDTSRNSSVCDHLPDFPKIDLLLESGYRNLSSVDRCTAEFGFVSAGSISLGYGWSGRTY